MCKSNICQVTSTAAVLCHPHATPHKQQRLVRREKRVPYLPPFVQSLVFHKILKKVQQGKTNLSSSLTDGMCVDAARSETDVLRRWLSFTHPSVLDTRCREGRRIGFTSRRGCWTNSQKYCKRVWRGRSWHLFKLCPSSGVAVEIGFKLLLGNDITVAIGGP